MALTVTIGGATSDSYATLAEYEAYALAVYDDAFTGHGHDDQHEAELRLAARYLDALYDWHGYKASKEQARAWPRVTTILIDGWPILSTEIPQGVKDAQCEIAYRLHSGATPFATLDAGAAIREKVDVIEVEYAPGTARDRPMFPYADALVSDYIKSRKSGAGPILVIR